jgi:surface protein
MITPYSNIISVTTLPAFQFTIDTTNTSVDSTNADQFRLPLTTSTGLDCVVDWGDGISNTITNHLAPEVTHTYASSGTYTVKITGDLLGWRFSNTGDRLKILDVKQWSGLTINTDSAFWGCTNLTASATDAPTITSTSLSSYFRDCSNFNGAIGNWDVSNVTNIPAILFNATSFNQDISTWNTSSVTSMINTLNNADAFNQDISNWDISQVSSFVNFMINATGLSTTNYDLLLVGWEANLQSAYPSGVGYPFTISIPFGGSKYTLLSAAATARASLISVFGWTITDGGGI